MSRRALGISLMAAGGVLVIVALVGLLASGEPDTIAAPTTTQPAAAGTTAATSGTTAGSTTAPTTSTTTSTTEPHTTTTEPQVDVTEAVRSFVVEFTALIDAGDTEGLFDRLHPAVLDSQDADLCRAFIEREILVLVDYRLTGDPIGPATATFGEEEVDVYTAPVAFTFQGQAFDGEASFAMRDGELRWFTTCR